MCPSLQAVTLKKRAADYFYSNKVPPLLTNDVPFCVLTPKNVIFSFDLHEVVVQPNYWHMAHAVFCTVEGWKFICLLLLNPLIVVALLWRVMFGDNPRVTEHIWFSMVQQFPVLNNCTQFFINVANMFVLDEGTVKIVRELKARGFKVFLFSNIGEQFWSAMHARLGAVLDELFSDGLWIATPAKNYLAKPDPKAFQDFLDMIAAESDQASAVFFVDDSRKNVCAAEAASARFLGYTFVNSHELLHHLTQLGLLE